MKYDKYQDPEWRAKRGGGFDYGEEFTRKVDGQIRFEKILILVLVLWLVGAWQGWW